MNRSANINSPDNTGRLNVLAAAVPFGLGPAGKLATLVNGSPEINWYACGDPFDQGIFEPNSFRRHLWSRDPNEIRQFICEHQINRAVIVLDPELALLIEDMGIPVVYVDSLPFLWTEGDLVPTSVSVYCAQTCLLLPKAGWDVLRTIKNLVWIQGIVPATTQFLEVSESKSGQVMINFGGLSSPHGTGESYAATVFPPLLRALAKDTECQTIRVSSSQSGVKVLERIWDDSRDTIRGDQELSIGTLVKSDFLRETAKSERLITAPGLTTLLETASLRVPTIILPPQNLSQYMNGAMYRMASNESSVLTWPLPSMTFESLEPILSKGEDVVVNRIYELIDRASELPEVKASLEHAFQSALASATTPGQDHSIIDIIGSEGRAEVIHQLIHLRNHPAAKLEVAHAKQEAIETWAVHWIQSHINPEPPATPSATLFNSLVDSLGLLELTAACQEEFAVTFSTGELNLKDLQTVRTYAAAVARIAHPDDARSWHDVQFPPCEGQNQMQMMLRLRSQLPSEWILRLADGGKAVRIGVPLNTSVSEQKLLSIIQGCISR